MKKFAPLLAFLALWAPATVSASPGFASGLSSLKELADQIQAEEEPGFMHTPYEVPGGGDSANLNAYVDAGVYSCADSSAPAQIILASAKKGRGIGKARGRSRRSCGCASGCGMDQAGLQPVIRKFVAEAGKIGIHPVSCIRSQSCQNRLRACFERCGQRGRAAKNSLHSDGKACDFSKRDGRRLTALKKKTGLPIKRLTHGREGGGLHEYQ